MNAVSLKVTMDENKKIIVELPSEVASGEYQLLVVNGKYTSPEALALFDFPPVDLPLVLDKILLTTEEIYERIDHNGILEATELLRQSNFEIRSDLVRVRGICELLEGCISEVIEAQKANSEQQTQLNELIEWKRLLQLALRRNQKS
jgi:hypothetical protein